MPSRISRRRFFRRSAGLGAGALLSRPASLFAAADGNAVGRRQVQTGTTPFIVTSHSNETGGSAVEAAWEVLSTGGSALDAVEKATNIIEVDPEDTSVGYGGLPNERGVVQLDASIMEDKREKFKSMSYYFWRGHLFPDPSGEPFFRRLKNRVIKTLSRLRVKSGFYACPLEWHWFRRRC